MSRALALGFFFLGSLLLARAALACGLASPRPLVVDEGERGIDRSPPQKVASAGVAIVRGRGPRGGCGSQTSTSCDDLGTVTLHPTAPSDDRTAPGDLGYLVKLVGGHLPEGATLPSDAVLADPSTGILVAGWTDGATDDQESIDFSVTLTAVDRGGNAGPESDPIRVQDSGRGSGCRTARGGDGSSFAMVLGLLTAARVATRRGPRARRTPH